jgi:hypothetical protein
VITGVTVKNCTLAPRIVQGVDQLTTGIVMPRQLPGVELRHPQSAVFAKYTPWGSGIPDGRPTNSPGWVTDAAHAVDVAMKDVPMKAVVAAKLTKLLRIFASEEGLHESDGEQQCYPATAHPIH